MGDLCKLLLFFEVCKGTVYQYISRVGGGGWVGVVLHMHFTCLYQHNTCVCVCVCVCVWPSIDASRGGGGVAKAVKRKGKERKGVCVCVCVCVCGIFVQRPFKVHFVVGH